MNTHLNDFKKISEIIKDGSNELYLIKGTSSKFAEKKREVYFVEIVGDVTSYFREKYTKNLEKFASPNYKTFDFYDERNGIEDLYIKTIDIKPVEVLAAVNHSILNELPKENESSIVRTINKKTIPKLKGYAISFRNGDGDKVIFYRTHRPGEKINSKGLTLTLNSGKFNVVEGDLFKIDEHFDGIFCKFKDKEIMYVINEGEFEKLFDFMDYYLLESKKAIDILKKSEHIQLSETIFEEIKQSKRLTKDCTMLYNRKYFDSINFELFNTISEKVVNTKQDMGYSVIDDKIIISDKNALDNFFSVLKGKITEDLIEQKLCKVSGKQII